MGFGGYYDVVETLKIIINNLDPELAKQVEKEKDIYILICIIINISKLKKDK
jgi:hypothetical protein